MLLVVLVQDANLGGCFMDEAGLRRSVNDGCAHATDI